MRFPNFVGPSYVSQSANADCERLINWYPELVESQGAKARVVYYPTPGFSAFASVTESPVRGLFAHGGRAFAAVGQTLYELDSAGTATSRGTIARDTNPVTFSTNGDGGDEVFITSGDIGYIFDLNANTLTQVVTDVTMGGFLDGYFVALDAATSTLKISNLLDGTTWDPTQIAQRTAGSDVWRSMFVVNRELWLLGAKTSEVWYNAGTSPFPFAPIPGGFLEAGIAASFPVAALGEPPIWLGEDKNGTGTIWMGEGYGVPRRISTHAVEHAIQGYDTISDAVAWTYQQEGHLFTVFVFPSADAAWVYDAGSGMWHERLKWDSATATWGAYRAISHIFVFGKHLVGDRATGVIYEMDLDLYSDVGGDALRRVRTAPHLSQEERELSYHSLQIDFQAGVGLVSGQGSNPLAMLRYSNDGGRTFKPERSVSVGAIGKYDNRAIWRRLGRGRDRVFELSVSDPVPFRVVDAYLELSA